MVRLILLAAFVAVVAIAIVALLGTMQAIGQVATAKDENTMPATFKRISYVVLIVLLLGVTSGWIGGA